METAATTFEWIRPEAALELYSVRPYAALHYAQPGAEATICGHALTGLHRRGGVVAESVYIQRLRVGQLTRRLAAKTDCIRCMMEYCTQMRKFKT